MKRSMKGFIAAKVYELRKVKSKKRTVALKSDGAKLFTLKLHKALVNAFGKSCKISIFSEIYWS